MLTNSAVSLRVLVTLNGVATSVTAIGRAIGPVIEGWMFSIGLNIGYMILPWWTLAAIATLGAIPVWYLVEMEGLNADESADPESLDFVTADPRQDSDDEAGQTQAIEVEQRLDSDLNALGTDESRINVEPNSINSVESPLAMNMSSSVRTRQKDTS